MSLTALSFPITSLSSLQNVELLDAFPPRSLSERFIYYGAIDPRLPPLMRKTMQVALVTLAAFIYVVTLGMGALYVHNCIQKFIQYRSLQENLEKVYTSSEKSLMDYFHKYDESRNIDVIREASEQIFVMAQQGFLKRALYFAHLMPDLKEDGSETCLLQSNLDAESTQSELVVRIAAHLESLGEIDKAKSALQIIHNPIEKIKQIFFLCCRQGHLSEAEAVAQRSLDDDIHHYLKAQLALIKDKYESAFGELFAIIHPGMRISSLREMMSLCETPPYNSRFDSLKLRILKEIETTIADMGKGLGALESETNSQREALVQDMIAQRIFLDIGILLARKEFEEAINSLQKIEGASVKEDILREILDALPPDHTLSDTSEGILRGLLPSIAIEEVKAKLQEFLQNISPLSA